MYYPKERHVSLSQILSTHLIRLISQLLLINLHLFIINLKLTMYAHFQKPSPLTIMTTSNPPANHFNILYFASASSFTKKQFENLPAPLSTKDLFTFLDRKYPGIKKNVLDSCAVTINLDYVDMEEDGMGLMIKEGDEVGIIPPVSSG